MAALIALLFLLPFLFLLLAGARRSRSKNLPPGPTGWPVVGNLLIMTNGAPHVELARMSRTYGPLMLIKLGAQPVVVASTAAAAEEVLRTHDRAFSGRFVRQSLRMKNHLEYSLVWSDCTDYWKLLRRVVRTELFTTKMLDAHAHVREDKVSELAGFLGGSALGEAVKITDVVFGTLLNILGHVVFSKDVFYFGGKGDEVGLQRLIKELLQITATPNLADFYPILDGIDLQGLNKGIITRVKQVYKLWESTVRERRERNDHSKHDFLEVLLANGFTDEQINAMFLETFGPGSETSSTTIEWTMAEIVRNPSVMGRVREELDREIGRGAKVKESHLPRLHYLQACIKESMRLHPAAPFLLPHRAVEACEVMGYAIPKDIQVLVNAYAIGRDPDTWKDPDEFSPERFLLDSNLDFQGNNFQFLPFGSGRRICIGLPLASRTIPLILASLIHSFDWSLPGGARLEQLQMKETMTITLTKDPPLLLVPQLRA